MYRWMYKDLKQPENISTTLHVSDELLCFYYLYVKYKTLVMNILYVVYYALHILYILVGKTAGFFGIPHFEYLAVPTYH